MNRPTAPLTHQIIQELVADFLGVQAPFNAFRRDTASKGPIVPGLESLTKDQIFFYNYAMYYCEDDTGTEPSTTHPANEFRVNGVLSLLPEFASAFTCPVASSMNRN
ncbi:endothelin-converting enzyme-like 1-like protein [Aphelenchoides avenae]|nr:endothelin-converting enzyme-like 1-like protein [Aphelenchus avenae]